MPNQNEEETLCKRQGDFILIGSESFEFHSTANSQMAMSLFMLAYNMGLRGVKLEFGK